MVESAKIIWADGPGNMPSQPAKSQIRAWGTWLENLTASLNLAVSAAYIRGTKAQLDAVSGPTAGEVGIVVTDDEEDLRGIYVYQSGTWVKKLNLPADAAEAAAEVAEDARDIAVDARAGAEAARDIAAGYASDAVSQGNVPIYATVAGMSALSVPQGINAIRVNGYSAAGDGGGGMYIRTTGEPAAHNAGSAFRSADRFRPDGSTSPANGGWWIFVSARPRIGEVTGVWTAQNTAEYLAARMAAGETVKIAIFGDSTVDGDQTTGWTENPRDGSGNAVGNSDHNLTAPNAWPAKLQTLLRSMYNNANISVFNAGYTGKGITDGWAFNNYEPAIISNPYYGVPDATIVVFGLNDQRLAGSQVGTMKDEIRRLALKAMSYGSVPIFVTCDPVARNTSGWDNREISQQIDAAKVAVCRELDIPMWDLGGAVKKWANQSTDGYRWHEQQTDYVHFQDAGHALKAGWIAKQFFRDTVNVVEGQRQIIGAWDSNLSAGHDPSKWGVFEASNGRFAGNWIYTRSLIAADELLLDAWVWCESPAAALVYRSIDGDAVNSFANALTAGNYFAVNNIIAGNQNIRPSGGGFTRPTDGYLRSDVPSILCKLKWGLNRISYRAGSAMAGGSGLGFAGWLDILPFNPAEPRNMLRQSGPHRQRVAAGSGETVSFLPEFSDGSNVWGFEGGGDVEILAELVLPVGVGLVYGWNPAYSGSATLADGDKSFNFIFRYATNALRVYNGKINGGALTYGSMIGSGTVAAAGDALNLRIVISRSGDNQVITIYEDFNATALATITTPYTSIPALFGGVAGGFFVNRASVTGAKVAEIKSLTCQW